MSDIELKLGDRMRDKITGFKGVATAYRKFLNGCEQYGLEPEDSVDKDGKLPEGQYFDVGRLEHVKGKNFLDANPPKTINGTATGPGGPSSRSFGDRRMRG